MASRKNSFMIKDILHGDTGQKSKETTPQLRQHGNNTSLPKRAQDDSLTLSQSTQTNREYPITRHEEGKCLMTERFTLFDKSMLDREGHYLTSRHFTGALIENGHSDESHCYRTLPSNAPTCSRPLEQLLTGEPGLGSGKPWGVARTLPLSCSDDARILGIGSPSRTSIPTPPNGGVRAIHLPTRAAHPGLFTAVDCHGFRSNPTMYGSLSNIGYNESRVNNSLPIAIPVPVYLRTRASDMNNGPRKCRRSRTVFSELQLMGLEQRFGRQKYLSTPDRAELARALGLSQVQVKTWYQNRRMKWKKQVLLEGATEAPTKPKGRPRKDTLTSLTAISNSSAVKADADWPLLTGRDIDSKHKNSKTNIGSETTEYGHSNIDTDADIDNSLIKLQS